jgi:hypothetical protein
MSGKVLDEGPGVARIEGECREVRSAVRPHHSVGGCAVDIRQLHPVSAGFG